jgi:hypothetical protein
VPLPAADALDDDVLEEDDVLGCDDELLGCDDDDVALLGLDAAPLDFIAFVRMNPPVALALALPVVPVAPGVDVDADA